jgi:hypothetical protein
MKSVILMIMLLPSMAMGESLRGFEITPFAGYRVGGTFGNDEGEDLELDDGGSFGVVLNLMADANTQWELGWSRQAADADLTGLDAGAGETGIDIDYLQLGGTYLWDGALARPFMVATVGLTRFDPDDSRFGAETDFSFSIGGGLKVWPAQRIGLRLEGRFYGTVVDSDSSIFCFSGPNTGGRCLISASGDVLWQWEMMAGVVVRF